MGPTPLLALMFDFRIECELDCAGLLPAANGCEHIVLMIATGVPIEPAVEGNTGATRM